MPNISMECNGTLVENLTHYKPSNHSEWLLLTELTNQVAVVQDRVSSPGAKGPQPIPAVQTAGQLIDQSLWSK